MARHQLVWLFDLDDTLHDATTASMCDPPQGMKEPGRGGKKWNGLGKRPKNHGLSPV